MAVRTEELYKVERGFLTLILALSVVYCRISHSGISVGDRCEFHLPIMNIPRATLITQDTGYNCGETAFMSRQRLRKLSQTEIKSHVYEEVRISRISLVFLMTCVLIWSILWSSKRRNENLPTPTLVLSRVGMFCYWLIGAICFLFWALKIVLSAVTLLVVA